MNVNNSSKCMLGDSKILWICHLCLKSFHTKKEWEGHVRVHSIVELDKYAKDLFSIVSFPELWEDLKTYRRLILEGSEKK